MKEPSFYKPEKKRLAVVEGRVDERDLAYMYDYFQQQFGIYMETRSDLLRSIVEFATTVARKDRPDIRTLDTGTEAGEYLRRRGVGLRKGTSRRNQFERIVEASDSFDATHRADEMRTNASYIVDALQVLYDQGESAERIRARAEHAAEQDPTLDVDKIMRQVVQTSSYDPDAPPDTSNVVDTSERRPTGRTENDMDDPYVSKPHATNEEVLNIRKQRDAEQQEKMRRALSQLPTDVVKGSRGEE